MAVMSAKFNQKPLCLSLQENDDLFQQLTSNKRLPRVLGLEMRAFFVWAMLRKVKDLSRLTMLKPNVEKQVGSFCMWSNTLTDFWFNFPCVVATVAELFLFEENLTKNLDREYQHIIFSSFFWESLADKTAKHVSFWHFFRINGENNNDAVKVVKDVKVFLEQFNLQPWNLPEEETAAVGIYCATKSQPSSQHTAVQCMFFCCAQPYTHPPPPDNPACLL